MNNDINSLKLLINNLQLSVNNITQSFNNIKKIYQNSNNNLNIEYKEIDNTEILNKINNCYKYIDEQIEDLYIKTLNNEFIKKYIDDVDKKILNLINDNTEFNKIINQKLNNNIDNDLIIKNNIFINEQLENFSLKIDNLEFNKNQGLRNDEIHKIKNIIHSQEDIYNNIHYDIKEVKSDCNLLRNKIIDNFDDVIEITKNLQNQINEYKLNTNIEDLKNEINLLKNDNEMLKKSMKLILDKLKDKKLII